MTYRGNATVSSAPATGRRRTLLPPFVLPAAVVAYLLFGLGPNGLLAFFAMAVLLLGCALLWRPGETPILLYVFAFQWLQVSMELFRANTAGLAVNQAAQMDWIGGNTELATVLSLIGLLCLAVGLRLGAGPPRTFDAQIARMYVQRYRPSTWFWLFAATWLLAVGAQVAASAIPGLSQPLLALANLHWAFFFILTYAAAVRRDGTRLLWFAAFGLEFLVSLGAYFSSFTRVFVFAFFGLVAANVRVTGARILSGAVFVTAVLSLGIVWTAIKPEYRTFVSGGERAQIVTVGYGERVAKLVELTSQLDGEKLAQAGDALLSRIAYTRIFGAALDYVPSVVPHQWGALWLDAITRPFMPRLLFPDKDIIDESTLTNKYTGLGVSGNAEGTQISLGYMGDSYVDFGEYGMMLPIFVVALVLGRAYAWMIRHPNGRGILGFGLASSVLIPVFNLGISTAKLVGAFAVSMLVVWLLLQFFIPRFLPWLSSRRSAVPLRRAVVRMKSE